MMTTEQISPKTTKSERAGGISSRGRLASRAMLVGAIALAVTGIGTFVLGKAPMTGWVLMAHVSAAPLFALGLAFVALTWADRCRFGNGGSGQSCTAKAMLWLILACGLVVILSAVVPMTPLFGSGGQHFLYLTHRYSAIVLTGAVLLHLLSLARNR
jgi:hypothetical protein